MRLILVRHGQTTANVGRHLDTAAPGAALSDLGRRQAAALPGALDAHTTGTTPSSPIEAIYASTLVRTQQTAEPLAAALALPVEVRAGIREVSAGDLEMRNDEAAAHRYLATVFAWSEGDLDARMPGGEDGHEVYGRFDEVIEEVAASGVGTAVLVSHAAMIRSWSAARVGNITTAHVERHSLSNTGAVVLDGDPSSGWWALAWEDQALGGRRLDSGADEGPTAEPFSPSDGPRPARPAGR